MIDWSKFESPVHNSVIINIFKKLTLNLIRPAANIIFNSHNSKQIKSITQSRLRLRHLLGTYSKHSFKTHYTLSVIIEITLNYFVFYLFK